MWIELEMNVMLVVVLHFHKYSALNFITIKTFV